MQNDVKTNSRFLNLLFWACWLLELLFTFVIGFGIADQWPEHLNGKGPDGYWYGTLFSGLLWVAGGLMLRFFWRQPKWAAWFALIPVALVLIFFLQQYIWQAGIFG